MTRRGITQRPECFTLKNDHPLAQGLVFAGLGAHAGSTRYHDSSVYRNHGTLDTLVALNTHSGIGRNSFYRSSADSPYQHGILPVSSLLQFGTDDFTLSMWGYGIRGGTAGALCGAGDGGTAEWMLYFTSDTTLRMYGYGSAIQSDLTWTLNAWNHVVVRRSGTILQLYKNGAFASEDTTANSNLSTTKAIRIGGADGGTTRWFSGSLADFMVHRRALTLPEIQILADPSNVMLSGLIQPPKRKYFTVPYYTPLVARRATYYTFKTSYGQLSVKG